MHQNTVFTVIFDQTKSQLSDSVICLCKIQTLNAILMLFKDHCSASVQTETQSANEAIISSALLTPVA